ncbi:MAG TPA: hypothetical protein VE967_13525 [Gemmatimonadaceae bacterium]|nr:hypothetical protein [Gemmatimonadaceae bacterium]
MHTIQTLERRLATAERRLRALALFVVVLVAAIAIGAARPQADVVKTRGLVILDAAGRERIVLGAPMSNASADTKLAQTIGVAVLDSLGRMNVALGTNNPLVVAPNTMGQRISVAAGLNIYDPRTGVERGGMGAFADGRANMCLDWAAKPKEAGCLTLAPNDQYAAFILQGGPNEKDFDRVAMYLDATGIGALKAFGGFANRNGILMQAGKGALSVALYDSAGKEVGDLAKR